ncbi:MAG TPA: DUF3168 domain-containing protein [Anaerolineaceae bacterium]|nr:DUF3168 domain-containing protein [Anaerolineaceae bacterium]
MSIPALNTAIYTAIGGTLTSAGTAVFYLAAPDGQALPYIVWDYTADIDENMDRNRTRNSLVFIRAYASTAGAAGTIDGQVDALLHMKALTITGWSNFWTARENSFSSVETDQSGRKVFMAGAEYRIRNDQS